MKVHVHNDVVRQRTLVYVEQGIDADGVRHYMTAEGEAVVAAGVDEIAAVWSRKAWWAWRP